VGCGVSNAGNTGGVRQDFARSIYANEAPPQGAGALTNTRDTINGDGIPNRLRLRHRRQLAASHIIDETANLYILWDER
jgi:hypothetical protein